MECDVVFLTSIRGGFKYDVPHLTHAIVTRLVKGMILQLSSWQSCKIPKKGIRTGLIFQRKSLKAFWIWFWKKVEWNPTLIEENSECYFVHNHGSPPQPT